MARPKKREGTGCPKSRRMAFDKVKGQIGPCGLWCGSCAYGNGTIRDLSRRLESAARDYGIEEWGPSSVDYQDLHRYIAAIAEHEPCPGCLMGGGRADCEMRACSRQKGLRECSECAEEGTCHNTEVLMHMRTGGAKVGMAVKKRGSSRRGFLSRSATDLKKRGHSVVIFLE